MSEKDECIKFICKLIEIVYSGKSSDTEIDLSSYNNCACLLEMLIATFEQLRNFKHLRNHSIGLVLRVDKKVDIDIRKFIDEENDLKNILGIKMTFCRALEKSTNGNYAQFVYYPVIKMDNKLIILEDLKEKFHFENFTSYIPCKDMKLEDNKCIFKDVKIILKKLNNKN